MSHTHDYATRRYIMLSLPDSTGRYELLQQFLCACGRCLSCTSWSMNTGRHHSLAELQAIQAREKAKPQRRLHATAQ